MRRESERVHNLQLETFICVADAGSFNKAAEKLYISPPAVIKQINAIESELGLTLFVRTNRGLKLTDTGESFYKDVKYMIQYFKESVARAKSVNQKNEHILRIGTSPMTPGKFLVDLWPKIHSYLPDMKFRLIPYENNPDNAKKMREFGRDVDLIVGQFDEDYLRENECAATKLSDEPLVVAVSVRHKLASKSMLEIEDLFGENLMMIHPKWNRYIDNLRKDISLNYPQINIVDFDFYGTDAYNQCESSQSFIVTIDKLKDIHPLLKLIPVRWNYTVPFGILHSPQPSETVRQFLNAVQKTVNN